MTARLETPLLTIGYEGKTLDDFLTALIQAKVRRVVDVRYLPLSRKKGFSKSTLAAALTSAGVEYVGLRELGTPPAMRNEYKLSGDFARLASDYRSYLADRDAQLDVLHNYAASGGCCLLCFERDANSCHRSVLADVVASRNGQSFRVLHV